MEDASLKINRSGLSNLNNKLNQHKSSKDIEQEKLSGQTIHASDVLSGQENSEDSDHTLIYDHSIDYKIYRFNGRLHRDEAHLGQYFDEVV